MFVGGKEVRVIYNVLFYLFLFVLSLLLLLLMMLLLLFASDLTDEILYLETSITKSTCMHLFYF